MQLSETVTRPPVPPVAWFGVAMWIGCLAGERAVIPSARTACALFAVIVAGVMAAGLRYRAAIVVLASAGLLTGVCASALQAGALLRQCETAEDCGAREWRGTVEADAMPGSYGAFVRVRIEGGPLDGARVRVGWPEGEEVPDLGRVVAFSAILKPLPIAEPWGRRAARAGTCASGTAWKAATLGWVPGWRGALYTWRAASLQRMHALPGPGGDLAEGIVLGDRRRLLGTATEQDFQVLGLSHLVAVSGSHLALACGAVAFIGMLLRLPKRSLVTVTVLAGAAYAVVTGMPYSALRSLLMLVISGAGQVLGRRGDGVASLGVAVVAVLAVEPWAAFDLGLQLSALAVASLLLYGSLATAWLSTGVTGPARLVTDPIALTLVAQIATVPVVAAAFGMVSILAPVANAASGFFVSAALLVGLPAVIVWSVAPAAGELLMRTCVCVLSATAALAEVMAALPGAAVAAGGGGVLAVAVVVTATAVWVRWPLPRSPRSSRRFVAAVVVVSLALALGPSPPQQAEVLMLDVGQGDAVLVRDSGRVMLVDTGPNGLALRKALARSGVRRIDVLVLTHAHDDHTGGNSALAAIAEVGWIGVPKVAESSCDLAELNLPECAAPVRYLAAGDRWYVGNTRVEVLWPPIEQSGELSTNNTSVVLRMSHGPFDMALTGDAEEAAQQGMAASAGLSPVEVLKVPHHGSRNGLTEAGLDAWQPRVALISVGEGNDFGHPSPQTIELLQSRRAQTWRTDRSGDLTVKIGRTGFKVVASRRGRSARVRARMGIVRDALRALTDPRGSTTVRGSRGTQARIAQAGLPDLRRRGTPARPRSPPIARSRGRRGRPGLQLRGVRR